MRHIAAIRSLGTGQINRGRHTMAIVQMRRPPKGATTNDRGKVGGKASLEAVLAFNATPIDLVVLVVRCRPRRDLGPSEQSDQSQSMRLNARYRAPERPRMRIDDMRKPDW